VVVVVWPALAEQEDRAAVVALKALLVILPEAHQFLVKDLQAEQAVLIVSHIEMLVAAVVLAQ
jgi:hypothetical protein